MTTRIKRASWTGLMLATCMTVAVVASDRDRSSAASGGPATSSIGYAKSLLVQLRVTDLARSIRFYRDVLDFDLVLRNDELRWAKVKPGVAGVTVGLGVGSEVKGSGTTSLNFGVTDIEAARRVLESRGVVFRGPTITIPEVVKLADFDDPDGNRIRLAQGLVPSPVRGQ